MKTLLLGAGVRAVDGDGWGNLDGERRCGGIGGFLGEDERARVRVRARDWANKKSVLVLGTRLEGGNGTYRCGRLD